MRDRELEVGGGDTADRVSVGVKSVSKPIELICCAPGQRYKQMQRRLLTAICHVVRSTEPIANGEFRVARGLLFYLVDANQQGLPPVYRATKELTCMRAFLNPFELAAPVRTAPILVDAEFRRSDFVFRLPPDMVNIIRSSQRFAEIELARVKQIRGVNMLALYELSAAFQRDGETPYLPPAYWSQLLRGHQGRTEGALEGYHLLARALPRLRASRAADLTLDEYQGKSNIDLVSIRVGCLPLS